MQIRNQYCPPFIPEKPRSDLNLIITIPCYNEPDLISSLQSLYDCDPIDGGVEIIVLINNSINTDNNIKIQNQKTFESATLWASKFSIDKKRFYIKYYSDLPTKHAGVGLARKIAMDEAASRFMQIDKSDGIIQCYDADSSCQPNLLQAVIEGFEKHNSASIGINYEHPIEGKEFSQDIYNAIISYELHLRYYVHIQRFIGLPFAYQTIGSSMAVRSRDYILQGGMNKRKAGEDFYFLQKFISIDRHAEINNTLVIPSPRISDRVPFGTGKAVNDILENNIEEFMSYNPKAFIELKILLDDIETLYKTDDIDTITNSWPNSLKSYFLEEEDIKTVIAENKSNTTNFVQFTKRFFKWFNAFRLMKFLHFCRDSKLITDLPIIEASYIYITEFLEEKIEKNEKDMLVFLRAKDRE